MNALAGQFIFWIVVMAILGGVSITWIKAAYRGSDRELDGRISELEADLAARDETIDKLEQRVRVLERITTDKTSQLRDEIDQLSA